MAAEQQNSSAAIKCFSYHEFPSVTVPAVLLPYVYCTCHMVRPVALVELRGPQVIEELLVNRHE